MNRRREIHPQVTVLIAFLFIASLFWAMGANDHTDRRDSYLSGGQDEVERMYR